MFGFERACRKQSVAAVDRYTFMYWKYIMSYLAPSGAFCTIRGSCLAHNQANNNEGPLACLILGQSILFPRRKPRKKSMICGRDHGYALSPFLRISNIGYHFMVTTLSDLLCGIVASTSLAGAHGGIPCERSRCIDKGPGRGRAVLYRSHWWSSKAPFWSQDWSCCLLEVPTVQAVP
jgi:hypothetical protein